MKSSCAFLLVGVLLLSAAASWAGTGPGARPGFLVATGLVQSVSPEAGDLQSFVLATIVPSGMGMPSRLITANVTTATQYFLGGASGSAADVKVGGRVMVQLKDFAGAAGTAVRVGIFPPPPPKPALVKGVVQSLRPETGDLQSFVVQPPALGTAAPPAPVTVKVTAETKYFLGDKPGAASDVKVGLNVVAKLTELVDNAGTATTVGLRVPPPPKPTIVMGVVKTLTPETGDLRSFVVQAPALGKAAAPAPVTVNVTAETKYFLGDKPATASDVKIGSKVVATLLDFAEGAGTAVKVGIQPPKPPKVTTVSGTVTAIAPETGELLSFVMQRPKPRKGPPPTPVTVTVNAATKYLLGHKPGSAADVKVGVRVVARLVGFVDNAGTAQLVQVVPVK